MPRHSSSRYVVQGPKCAFSSSKKVKLIHLSSMSSSLPYPAAAPSLVSCHLVPSLLSSHRAALPCLPSAVPQSQTFGTMYSENLWFQNSGVDASISITFPAEFRTGFSWPFNSLPGVSQVLNPVNASDDPGLWQNTPKRDASEPPVSSALHRYHSAMLKEDPYGPRSVLNKEEHGSPGFFDTSLPPPSVGSRLLTLHPAAEVSMHQSSQQNSSLISSYSSIAHANDDTARRPRHSYVKLDAEKPSSCDASFHPRNADSQSKQATASTRRSHCPICGNRTPACWRYGAVSQVMVCPACGQYETRTGKQRLHEVEAKRLARRLAGGKR
ncbi:hypothetical protein C8F01DRAFT_272672 [Mycena amicta]|nr:hypothetical protein C8F01DRAFT_272672 [Mycena amicta]